MVPIIQREVDIFKYYVWNGHQIRAQKDTQLSNEVPNHIYNFPEKYGLQNKGSIIVWVRDAFLLNTPAINFMCQFSSTKNNINLSTYQVLN